MCSVEVLMKIIEVLQGLLTPVIAIAAVVIAYQQSRTNKQTLFLEQYDRRLKIYIEIRELIYTIVTNKYIEPPRLYEFRTRTNVADFLFGAKSDISDYIDEMIKHSIKLMDANNAYNFNTDDAEKELARMKLNQELSWFTEETRNIQKVFMKYLDVSN